MPCSLLVNRGADVRAQDRNGLVARQLAAKHQQHATAEALAQLARTRLMADSDAASSVMS